MQIKAGKSGQKQQKKEEYCHVTVMDMIDKLNLTPVVLL